MLTATSTPKLLPLISHPLARRLGIYTPTPGILTVLTVRPVHLRYQLSAAADRTAIHNTILCWKDLSAKRTNDEIAQKTRHRGVQHSFLILYLGSSRLRSCIMSTLSSVPAFQSGPDFVHVFLRLALLSGIIVTLLLLRRPPRDKAGNVVPPGPKGLPLLGEFLLHRPATYSLCAF